MVPCVVPRSNRATAPDDVITGDYRGLGSSYSGVAWGFQMGGGASLLVLFFNLLVL